MHKHEALLFTVFLRVYRFYIGFVTNYGLGAITLDFFFLIDLFLSRASGLNEKL